MTATQEQRICEEAAIGLDDARSTLWTLDNVYGIVKNQAIKIELRKSINALTEAIYLMEHPKEELV